MRTKAITAVRHWVGSSESWLEGFLATVPSIESIVSVVAIGSAVRERIHRRSDLDLLVVYQEKRPAIKSPLEIDIRYAATADAPKQIGEGHEILCWALKYGTPLYDPAGYWEQLEGEWQDRIPLPPSTAAVERATQSFSRAREMLEMGDESAADDLILAALTQFAREQLIRRGVFPASRPELADQLRLIQQDNLLAQLLDDAMYGDFAPCELIERISRL